jgi:hypothetical protein
LCRQNKRRGENEIALPGIDLPSNSVKIHSVDSVDHKTSDRIYGNPREKKR